MPTNIVKGNTANFVVEYLDASGDLTVPTGGSITIDYVSGLTTSSTTISLTLEGSFYVGSWDSSVADYGSAPWYVMASGSTAALKSGEMRVIGP